MSVEKFTIDTNILVYSVDRQAGERHEKAIELMEEMVNRDVVLTLQALSEFYSAVTRKNKMPHKDAQAQINDWMILYAIVTADPAALKRAMLAVEHHHLSFWDSLFLETALQAGVTVFISEDMQHGQLWKGMRITNPFG